jgi:hypothetical protein
MDYLPEQWGTVLILTQNVELIECDENLNLFRRCAETITKMHQIAICADDPDQQNVADQMAAVYNSFVKDELKKEED